MSAAKECSQFIRRIRAQGWAIQRTRRQHIKLTHPAASGTVYGPGTTGDWRVWRNVLRDMRRVLREGK